MTSPRITSMFFPPACISVRSWSKRCPVSAAPSRKTILSFPWLLSLNLSTSFRAVPVSSGDAVKTSSPPPCCPPQPAGPSRAAPANPAPPIFKKLLRDRVLEDCPRVPSLCLMTVCTREPSRPVPGRPWLLLPDSPSPATIWYRPHLCHANGARDASKNRRLVAVWRSVYHRPQVRKQGKDAHETFFYRAVLYGRDPGGSASVGFSGRAGGNRHGGRRRPRRGHLHHARRLRRRRSRGRPIAREGRAGRAAVVLERRPLHRPGGGRLRQNFRGGDGGEG